MRNGSLKGLVLFALAAAGLARAADLPKPIEDTRISVVVAGTPEETAALVEDGGVLVDGFGGRRARVAVNGDGFTYTLPVGDREIPRSLFVQYSGDDAPPRGEHRLLRIELDGEVLAYDGWRWNKKGRLYEIFYPIPAERLAGKDTVRVRLAGDTDKATTGQIHAVGIVREKTRPDGFDDPANYKGLGDGGRVEASGDVLFAVPAGTGAGHRRDGAIDFEVYYGLRAVFENHDATPRPLTVEFHHGVEIDKASEQVLPLHTRSARFVAQPGVNTLDIPADLFRSPDGNNGQLANTRFIRLRFGEGADVTFTSLALREGKSVFVEAPRRSRAVGADETARYVFTVENMEDVPQTVFFQQRREGWEAMKTTFEPSEIALAPRERKDVTVAVTVPASLPHAAKETQRIQVVPSHNPDAMVQVDLITLRRLPHPYTIHTASRWDDVRRKSETVDWAIEAKAKLLERMAKWNPPAMPKFLLTEWGGRCLMHARVAHQVFDAALAWQLSREPLYAEKVKTFLLGWSDPVIGYPATRFTCTQNIPQEGPTTYLIAQAYDMVADSGLFSDADTARVENALRINAESAVQGGGWPTGANWSVSIQTGHYFAALAIQDMHLVDRMLFAPSKLMDLFRAYTMPDGWWSECTVSYNLWCTEMFTQIALGAEPFGYSLLTQQFPCNYILFPEFDRAGGEERHISRNVHHGHSFRLRGGVDQPFITIRRMSEALLPFLDYRGVVFGINDSNENLVGGDRLEISYFAYRDPRLVPLIKKQKQRGNLIYGVADLPDVESAPSENAYSDNAGVMLLRSKQDAPRERIQGVLKYGTHGGYHGHFDRVSMLSLMRYGRSFFSPKMTWYSYPPFMYNFYVQSSCSKNMVMVDAKQQEADDSRRVLFHSGDLFQAGAVEGVQAWSYPAYLGLKHSKFNERGTGKADHENRWMPIPEKHPDIGTLSGFTEPILQRRLMLVTDDYVLLADLARSTDGTEHTYDNILQIKGFLGLDAPKKTPLPHRAQFTDDPFTSAQLITDVDSYTVEGTAKASFLTKFGPGADYRGTQMNGEDGDLYMNVWHAWPNTAREFFAGAVPENRGTERRIRWRVAVDGEERAKGDLGAWVIGAGRIDLDVTGAKTLTLELGSHRMREATVFWGAPVLETADGKTIELRDLPIKKDNVRDNPRGFEKDYAGGPVTLAGERYAWALAAEPADHAKPGVYTVDLTGLDAVRFRSVAGSDYFTGDQSQRRLTSGVRAVGADARFLTVIEPFEKEGGAMVAGVDAESADRVTVRLADGRRHVIALSAFGENGGDDIQVSLEEWRDDERVAIETTRK